MSSGRRSLFLRVNDCILLHASRSVVTWWKLILFFVFQRNSLQGPGGEEAQRLQEGREGVQTEDSGGQRGRQQHLERQLHAADVDQDPVLSLQRSLLLLPVLPFS